MNNDDNNRTLNYKHLGLIKYYNLLSRVIVGF